MGDSINTSRNSDIEVLRGIAVIYVVVFHAYGNLIPWRSPELSAFFLNFGGSSGVDLFFVISGFVIARSLIPKLGACGDKKEFWVTSLAFWIRRYWRLLPTAWLWIGIVLLSSIWFNSSGAFGTFRANLESGLSAIFQVANFHLAYTFGTPGSNGALFPLWSLSLEEQFYLLLPVLVLITGRWLPYVLIAAVAIQLASTRSGLYEMLLRTDGLLIGVLLAMYSQTRSYLHFEPFILNRNRLIRTPLLIILFLCLAVIGAENLTMVSYSTSIITLVSTALVFFATYDQDYIMRKGPAKQVLMWVGSRSYAIYVIHIPAFYMSREIWFLIGEPSSTKLNPAYLDQLVITSAILILVFSELNYRFIELPLRLKGREISKQFAARHSNNKGGL